MKTKICTSIEQSKKLLELGLDADTADMWYLPIKDTYELVTTPSLTRNIIPAWSLSALLKLMPQRIYLNGAAHQFRLDRNWDKVTWQCAYDAMNSYIEQKDLSPLDAAYSMVVLLIEQGYIKTEKK